MNNEPNPVPATGERKIDVEAQIAAAFTHRVWELNAREMNVARKAFSAVNAHVAKLQQANADYSALVDRLSKRLVTLETALAMDTRAEEAESALAKQKVYVQEGVEETARLVEERDRLREATLREACKMMCVFCRDEAQTVWDGKMNPFDVGDVEVEPEFIERQYISNNGVCEGWMHRDKYGYVHQCGAGAIHAALAPPADRVTAEEGR